MMTPDEAQKTLYEAGFFTRWDNRVLYGGTYYKPGRPGAFDGRRFEITLLRLGVCVARVTDFEGESTLIDEGADGKKDLGSIVLRLIVVLDRNQEEPVKVPLWAAVELGRAAPTATSEVEALSSLFWPADSLPTPLSPPPPAGLTEEQRLELPEPREPREPREPEWVPLAQESVAVGPVGARPVSDRLGKYRRPYGGFERTMARHTRRTFLWAPLAARESWPTKLHPPFLLAFSEARELDTVNFVSAIRQSLDHLPEWMELIVFSTEPVDGNITTCFSTSKAEVPDRPHPDWLVTLLSLTVQETRRSAS